MWFLRQLAIVHWELSDLQGGGETEVSCPACVSPAKIFCANFRPTRGFTVTWTRHALAWAIYKAMVSYTTGMEQV